MDRWKHEIRQRLAGLNLEPAREAEIVDELAQHLQEKDIYRAILGRSGRPIAIGLSLGLAFTVATWSAIGPLLQSQEFTFTPEEPVGYAMTAVLLAVVAVTAMLIPARRATRVDPMVALREE